MQLFRDRIGRNIKIGWKMFSLRKYSRYNLLKIAEILYPYNLLGLAEMLYPV